MSRDRTVGDTFFHMFPTRRFSTGETFTLAGSPVVSAYEDGSATQITAGITLGVDHDSVTGLNVLTIVATGANGFESGKDYHLVITTGTVDGVSVTGEVVGHFSLGLSAAAKDLANATDGLGAISDQVLALNDISPAEVNAECDTSISDASLATSAEISALNDVSTAQVNAECDTSIADAALATAASIAALNDVSTAQVLSECQQALIEINLDHLLAASADGTDVADSSVIAQMVSKSATADWDSFNNATDALEAIVDRGNTAWITSTGGSGSDRLLMIDTTIASVTSPTVFILTDGSDDDDAYNNLTVVVEDAVTATQKAASIIIDYDGGTKEVTLREALSFPIADTDKVYILAEASLKSSAANRQLDVSANGNAGINWGNVENPDTVVDLSQTSINICDIVFFNNDNPDNFSDMSIEASTGLVDITQAAADKGWTSSVRILTSAANITEDASAINMSASGVIGQVFLVGTTITNTDMRGTDGAATPGAAMALTASATSAQLISDILTTQMTESYAADGVAPTLEQALFLIQQVLTDFGIVGTTNTIRKLDGATTAAEMTLDSSSNPTDSTRTL